MWAAGRGIGKEQPASQPAEQPAQHTQIAAQQNRERERERVNTHSTDEKMQAPAPTPPRAAQTQGLAMALAAHESHTASTAAFRRVACLHATRKECERVQGER